MEEAKRLTYSKYVVKKKHVRIDSISSGTYIYIYTYIVHYYMCSHIIMVIIKPTK